MGRWLFVFGGEMSAIPRGQQIENPDFIPGHIFVTNSNKQVAKPTQPASPLSVILCLLCMIQIITNKT